MDLKVFEPHELTLVLRALRHVAFANEAFTTAECDFIEGVAAIHGTRVDATRLEPIEFSAVARVLRDPHRRKRAVQLAIVTALVEGQPDARTEQAVRAFAHALEMSDAGLTVLYDVAHGQMNFARFDMLRRVSRVIRSMENFPGFLKTLVPALGLGGTDRVLAARYHALANCPPGSFGRAFYDHCASNGFPFPGERHGFAAIVFHDVGHVLSGYSVDPQGEIQQAAFQAGFVRNDGFSFLLFGILQFHIGLRITPVAKGQRGLFDVSRVLRAAERGAACNTDLSAGFDVFEHAEKPLDDLRRELGIPPH